MSVIARSDCLNKTDNKSIDPKYCSIRTKGKTYEEIYGPEKAQKLRKQRSESNRNRTHAKLSLAIRKHMSNTRRSGDNSNAKAIFIQIESNSYTFKCMNDCYDFLSYRYDITRNNARYVIRTKLASKQIPIRKNYVKQRQVYDLISLPEAAGQ